MEELGTRCTTERVRVGNSPPTGARAVILPDIGHLPAGTGNNLQGLPDEADNRRREEDFGLAHELIRAMMEG